MRAIQDTHTRYTVITPRVASWLYIVLFFRYRVDNCRFCSVSEPHCDQEPASGVPQLKGILFKHARKRTKQVSGPRVQKKKERTMDL